MELPELPLVRGVARPDEEEGGEATWSDIALAEQVSTIECQIRKL